MTEFQYYSSNILYSSQPLHGPLGKYNSHFRFQITSLRHTYFIIISQIKTPGRTEFSCWWILGKYDLQIRNNENIWHIRDYIFREVHSPGGIVKSMERAYWEQIMIGCDDVEIGVFIANHISTPMIVCGELLISESVIFWHDKKSKCKVIYSLNIHIRIILSSIFALL